MSEWARSPDVAFEQSEARLVLLDLADLTSPPRALSGSAATIWALLDTQHSEDDLVGAVAETYGVPVDRVREPVREFLAELESEGLVVRR